MNLDVGDGNVDPLADARQNVTHTRLHLTIISANLSDLLEDDAVHFPVKRPIK